MSNSSGPESFRAASDEAVRVAEQTVSDAWIGQLLLAESESQTLLDACTHIRERTAGLLRAAERTDDPVTLARSRTALELAENAREKAYEVHERAADRLTHELMMWSHATARRVRQSLTDQS